MTHIDMDDDEVSLKEFKSQLNKFRSFLRQVFLGAVVLLRRYLVLILLLAIGFTAWGFYQYKYLRSYTSRASFTYIESQKKFYGEMADKLQDMIKTGSYKQVAKSLNIPLSQTYGIIAINAVNMQGAKLSEDITEHNKFFYVDVTATNSNIFDTLQTALEYYFNNNISIKQRMTGNRERIEHNIAYLKQELVKLDSLKVAYTNSLSKPNTSVAIGSNTFNPTDVYVKSEKISNDIGDLEILLKNNYKAVQLQDGFMVSQSPNESLFAIAAKCFVYFVVVSFGMIFVISIFRK
jgi:hypothetical protein